MTSLNGVSGTGTGTPYAIGTLVNGVTNLTALQNWSVQISGSATFNVSFQTSLDGVNWVTQGSAITSTSITSFTGVPACYVQLLVNSISGGSITGTIVGAA
jgi:hypothetical protein